MANRFSELLRKFGQAIGALAGDTPPSDGGFEVSQDAETRTDTVGRVYAAALLDLARAQGALESIDEEVTELLGLLRREPGLHKLLASPKLNASQRRELIDRLFNGKVSDLMFRFLQVVNRKGRLGDLESILVAFTQLAAEARGEADVDIYVAQPLEGEESRQVAESIGQAVGKQVRLRQHVDPELIGGLKVRVADRLIDGSVATQLKIMKQRLVAAGREKARVGSAIEN